MKLKQVLSLVGALMAIVGAVLFLMHGRVVATYLLDLIVITIGPGPPVPPPYEFSWGEMIFGQSPTQLRASALAVVLTIVGILLIMPSLVTGMLSSKWQRGLLAGSGLVLLISGACSLLLWYATLREFQMLAHGDAVDPLSFGESLLVPQWNVCRFGILLAILVWSLLAFRVSKPDASGASKMNIIMVLAGMFTSLYFVLLLLLSMGPACSSFDLSADPVELAGHISLAIRLLLIASLSLLLGGLLTAVSAFRR